MEAKELRIGNLITFLDSDWEVVVESIFQNDGVYYVGYDGGVCAVEKMKGIELSEERLRKFGLKKEDGRFKTANWSGLCIEFDLQWTMFRANRKSRIDEICFGFKYVHQLQNLYFALTGQELTTNDPQTTP